MYSERKLRYDRSIIYKFYLCVLLVVSALLFSDKVMAETLAEHATNEVQKNVFKELPVGQSGENTTVGRYALNYTGNINVYSSPSSGNDDISYCSQTLSGWSNSSRATLHGDNSTTHIVRAYLIWETRKRYNKDDNNANHVSFLMRDARTRWNIYPDWVFADDRSSRYVSGWEQSRPRIYCNVADVTTIVKTYGYGDYYVANIPVCRASDLWEQDTGGGGTPTGWQLIVVEENASYPVRAVTLSVGSRFRFGDVDWEGDDYGFDPVSRATVTMQAELFDGLKTKEYGDVTGQILFGCIDAARVTENPKLISMFTQQARDSEKNVRNGGTVIEGLYRDGSLFCQQTDMCSVLYNVSGLSYGATVFGVDVANVRWDTQLYIGAAVDIAFPEFESQQTTSISDGKVIVKGKIENTSAQDDTGLFDGELTVTLDPNLTPDLTNYNIAVNSNIVSSATVRQGTVTGADGTVHNTVIFSGGGISSWFKGDKIEYTIYCRISGSGMSRFDNRDQLDGYLKSAGVDTGHWIDKACIASSWCNALFRVDLIAGNGIQSVSGVRNYMSGAAVTIDAVVKNGYHWTGWTGTYETDRKQYAFAMPVQNVRMTANAQINHSTLKVDPNGGTWQGSTAVQSFTEHYGTAKSILHPVRTGYTFSGWVKSDPFNGSLNNAVYTFGAEDDATDVLTASWTANSYTLHFDPNDGKEQAPIDDITIMYDQNVTLPDATGRYIRYTLDGEDITQQVLDGTIVLDDSGVVVMVMDADTGLMMTPAGGIINEDGSVADLEVVEEDASSESTEALEKDATEAEADVEELEVPEESETPAADPVSDKKAYAAVFMGWSLEDGRDSFIPQWTAGMQVSVADLIEAAGVADQNGAMITLYASWDDCPWIVATNLYYTLEQAQQGVITDSEILSHATASDREDGSPIEAGFHENGTSFSIPDYQASDFTQFLRGGSCTENLTVVDSAGSIYCKQITVYVVDTTPADARTERTTRFIDEKYYGSSYERGGLLDDSIWKTDTAYVSALRTAFGNLENDAPVETYTINGEARRKIREYVDAHGFGDSREVGALQEMYDRYLVPNRVR